MDEERHRWTGRENEERGEVVVGKLSGSREVPRKQVVIFTLLLHCFAKKITLIQGKEAPATAKHFRSPLGNLVVKS